MITTSSCPYILETRQKTFIPIAIGTQILAKDRVAVFTSGISEGALKKLLLSQNIGKSGGTALKS